MMLRIKNIIMSLFLISIPFATCAERSSRIFCDVPEDKIEDCIVELGLQMRLNDSKLSNYSLAHYAYYFAKRGNIEATNRLVEYFNKTKEDDSIKDMFIFFDYLAQMHKNPSYEIAQKAVLVNLHSVNFFFSQNASLYFYEILLEHDTQLAEKFFSEYIEPLLLKEKINPFVYIRFLQEKGKPKKLDASMKYVSSYAFSTPTVNKVRFYLSHCNVSEALNVWNSLSKYEKREVNFHPQMGVALIQKQEFTKAFRFMKSSYHYKNVKKGLGQSGIFDTVAQELSYHPNIVKKASKFLKPIHLTAVYAKALYQKGYKEQALSLSFANKDAVLNAEEINQLIAQGQYGKADENLNIVLIDGRLSKDTPFAYLDPIIHISLADNEVGQKYRKAIYSSSLKSYGIDIALKYKVHDYAAMALNNIINQFSKNLGGILHARGDGFELTVTNADIVFDNFRRYLAALEKFKYSASWDFSRSAFEYNANYCRDKVR